MPFEKFVYKYFCLLALKIHHGRKVRLCFFGQRWTSQKWMMIIICHSQITFVFSCEVASDGACTLEIVNCIDCKLWIFKWSRKHSLLKESKRNMIWWWCNCLNARGSREARREGCRLTCTDPPCRLLLSACCCKMSFNGPCHEVKVKMWWWSPSWTKRIWLC